MENFNTRLLQFFGTQDLSVRKIEEKIGLSNGTIKRIDKGNTINSDKIELIFDAFPELNSRWLFRGVGNMLHKEEGLPVISEDQVSGVPYYDVDFSGGFNAIFNNQTLLPDHNIVFEPFKDAQLWCNVTGNSMADKINHGDIIALKELPNWDENILFGEIYAVVTNHLRTIKVIRKSEDKNRFRLVPLNKAEHDENEIKKDSIIKVFEVLGAIKKFF